MPVATRSGRTIRGLLCVVVLLPGCLQAERFSVLRYDAQDDSFHHLRVYLNIRSRESKEAARSADFDHLAALWEQRERVLMVNPMSMRLFGDAEEQWLREGPRRYRQVSLGRNTKTKPTDAPVDLDSFRTRAGRLFLSHEQTLCYYHQTAIPGAAVDAWLRSQQTAFREHMASEVRDEQKRRQDGADRLTWAQVREALRLSLAGMPVDDNRFSELSPLSVLQRQSLQRLAQGMKNETAGFTRSGRHFALQFELTAADARELLRTFEVVKEGVRQQRRDRPPQLDWVEKVCNLLEVTAEEGKVTLRVDSEALFNDEPVRAAAFTPDELAASAAAIDEARARNLPIDAQLTLDDILERFEDGKLE